MEFATANQDASPVWRAPSLRARIAVLAGTVVVLLTLTLCILIWVLRSTQANTVERSQKHLQAVAHSLAVAYQMRADRKLSLSLPRVGPPPPKVDPLHPVPPPPPPPNPGSHPPPTEHWRSPEEQALEAITSQVLQDETGVEGGFYSAADQRLVGYAFPTHEGPGDPKALPARETPKILSIASAAFAQRSIQEDLFFGPHDGVLFLAVPVCDTNACTGGPIGSAWLMQRMPGAETDRKRTILWSAFAFGTAACFVVILAFLALQQVGRGTQAVLDRLTWMESNLRHQPRTKGVKLAEFHEVLDGLDRLGDTLSVQMERERDLQSRLRQNERLAEIGRLAAGVAHELRNPLATIRLRAQMTQRKTQETSTSQASSVILAEIDRLDNIIERLLDFSRPIRLHPVSTDISALAEATVQRWTNRNPEIAMRYSGAPAIFALADPDRLAQVLDNLFDNAVQQLKESKTPSPAIEIGCHKDGEHSIITVSDNGGGFTPEALPAATQPFFTTRAKGTGLGLAITQEIVHAMEGTLVLSNHDDGALVRIQLSENASPVNHVHRPRN